MTLHISKLDFVQDASSFLDQARKTGDTIIVTENGLDLFELKPIAEKPDLEAIKQQNEEVFSKLRGSVKFYIDPFEPVGLDDWEALK